MGNVIGQRIWAKSSKLEKLSKTCSFRFLCVPPSLEIWMLLSCRYTERVPFTGGCFDPFRWRSESPSCTCHFSNFFSLKYSICQDVIFWGTVSWTPSTYWLGNSIIKWGNKDNLRSQWSYQPHSWIWMKSFLQICWPQCNYDLSALPLKFSPSWHVSKRLQWESVIPSGQATATSLPAEPQPGPPFATAMQLLWALPWLCGLGSDVQSHLSVSNSALTVADLHCRGGLLSHPWHLGFQPAGAFALPLQFSMRRNGKQHTSFYYDGPTEGLLGPHSAEKFYESTLWVLPTAYCFLGYKYVHWYRFRTHTLCRNHHFWLTVS